MPKRPIPFIQVLVGLVVAPVLLGAGWEAITFFQEDDPWLAMIVLGTLAVLAVVLWLVAAERPGERWALAWDRVATWWSRLAPRPEPGLRTSEDRLFVVDRTGEVAIGQGGA